MAEGASITASMPFENHSGASPSHLPIWSAGLLLWAVPSFSPYPTASMHTSFSSAEISALHLLLL